MNRIDRRTYLALVAGGTIAIAGCTGDEDGGEPTGEPDDEDQSAEKTTDDSEPNEQDESDDSDESDERTESDESDSTFEIGDVLEMGELQAIVADLRIVEDMAPEPGGEVLEAADGTAFAIVDLALHHGGEEGVVTVDEAMAIGLVGDDEEAYGRADGFETEAPDLTESRLAAGEVGRGDLVFEIDDDSDEVVLELESLSEAETYGVEFESERATDSMELFEQNLIDVLGFSQGAERGGIDVTVSTLEHGNNLGGFMQSDEGHEIVAVGVTIDNASGRDRTLEPGQVQLKDGSGRSLTDAPGMLRALENLDGTTLADGEEHDGKVAYQIEEGIAELYWIFDFAEWGEDERVFWQLR